MIEDSHQIAALIERLGRLLSSDSHGGQLQPVQWETLRYLARANRFSRNGAALTAYLGCTKGTVSQTLKALEGRRLISRQADPRDRRRQQLVLTGQGQALLQQDPLLAMEAAIASLPQPRRQALEQALSQLLFARLDQQGRQPFGQCRHCLYFGHHQAQGPPHYCNLLQTPLGEADAQAICVEQVPAMKKAP